MITIQQTRVRLADTDPEDLDGICDDVCEIANKTGINLSGPIPLPTKTLKVPTRKSLDGEGTATWEHWEMHVHERLIDLSADERALHQSTRVQIPNGVSIEIALED